MNLREAAKALLDQAMAYSGLTWKDLNERGCPEETARRITHRKNVNLDTLEKALAATGYRIAKITIEDERGLTIEATEGMLLTSISGHGSTPRSYPSGPDSIPTYEQL